MYLIWNEKETFIMKGKCADRPTKVIIEKNRKPLFDLILLAFGFC